MSSIDGLVTGMATSDIINQLMSLERQPVVRLQAKKSTNDKIIAALQALNTKFASLKDLATKFDPTKWSAANVSITASDAGDYASVQAAPGTAPTSISFQIQSLAQAHQVKSSAYASNGNNSAASQVTNVGSAVTISYLDSNGASSTLSVTNHDGSLQGIANAVNALSTSPVTALAVTDASGNMSLEFTAKKLGDFSRFDVNIPQRTTATNGPTPAKPTFSVLTSGTDAQISLGDGQFAKTVTSTTNLLEVAPGISVVLTAKPLTAIDLTISVTAASKPADEVQKIIDSANAILKEIKTLTGYDAENKKGGLLQGSSLLRNLQSSVIRAAMDAVGGDSAFEVGLEITRTGELEFDKAKFDAAYAADPAQVSALLQGDATTPGLIARLATLADEVTLTGTGRLTTAIESRRSEIRRIDDSIATWDARLIRREAALRRQFAAMETALGRSQQQGNWLAGQIASLPGMMTN